MKVREHAHWHVDIILRKYKEDIAPFKKAGLEFLFFNMYKPYEVIKRRKNVLLNEGINAMWTLICGGSETAFNAANARIGVGNDATAAAAAQTGLLGGANTAYGAMDSSYPTYGTSQKATFQASFTDAIANFQWNEWSVDNGTSANKNMNRKVENLGTKTGGTWTLQVAITIS